MRRLKAILEAGYRLESLFLTADAARGPSLTSLIDLISTLDDAESDDLKRLKLHARNLSAEMSARHLAGILVPFERLHGKALRDDEFIVDEGDRTTPAFATAPLKIIADNLRSAFNVGAIIRTAECFAVEEVILSGYTPTPDDDKTAKTSLGAQESVKWSSAENLTAALARAAREGYTVVALETVETAEDLTTFEWPEKTILLLGNERFGLDDVAMKTAQRIVRIPLYGKKNSLNVGIACGIALADWREKREAKSPLTYEPIGVFSASATHRYEARRQGSLNQSDQEAVIKLKSGQSFEQALKDLEGFERIWVVYDFHHNRNWKPLIRPPRGSHEKRGVFATRAPYRPNPIGLSCVELVRIEGLKVFVRGHDLLDGTPVLDLKPYIPYADSFPNSKIGWLEGVEESRIPVRLEPQAVEQLEWLEAHGVDQLRGFVVSQLEFDATDSDRKRVVKNGDEYRLAYRTWRVAFLVSDAAILIQSFSSGYSEHDLESPDDRYEDKALHREFSARFPSSASK